MEGPRRAPAIKKWHRGQLTAELKILQPTEAVFFTGEMDRYIFDEFPGVERKAVEGWKINELCRLSHPALPPYAVRCYHPNAQRFRPQLVKRMLNQIENELSGLIGRASNRKVSLKYPGLAAE